MPDPIRLEWMMDAHVQVFRPVQIGDTPNGFQQAVPIGAGTFAGPRLRGSAISGSADWQLVLEDGMYLLDVTGAMLTDDGVTIRVSSKGMRHGPPDVMARLTRAGLSSGSTARAAAATAASAGVGNATRAELG